MKLPIASWANYGKATAASPKPLGVHFLFVEGSKYELQQAVVGWVVKRLAELKPGRRLSR